MLTCRAACFLTRTHTDIAWAVTTCRFPSTVHLTLEPRITRGTDHSVWMKTKVGMQRKQLCVHACFVQELKVISPSMHRVGCKVITPSMHKTVTASDIHYNYKNMHIESYVLCLLIATYLCFKSICLSMLHIRPIKQMLYIVKLFISC